MAEEKKLTDEEEQLSTRVRAGTKPRQGRGTPGTQRGNRGTGKNVMEKEVQGGMEAEVKKEVEMAMDIEVEKAVSEEELKKKIEKDLREKIEEETRAQVAEGNGRKDKKGSRGQGKAEKRRAFKKDTGVKIA